MRLIASQITGLHLVLGGQNKIPPNTDPLVDKDSLNDDKKGRKVNKSKNNNDSSNNSNNAASNSINNNVSSSGNHDRANHLVAALSSNGLGAIKEEEDEDGAAPDLLIPPNNSNNNSINNAADINVTVNNINVNVNANPKKNPQKVQVTSVSKDSPAGDVGWKPWSHIFSTSGSDHALPPYNAHGKYCVKLHWMVSLKFQLQIKIGY